MDPQNQQETGKFGDTTEAVTDPSAGKPVDNTDDNGSESPDVEVKTEVSVDDNASEAASVQTVNTPEVHGTTAEGTAAAGDSSVNVRTGLGGDTPPPTPSRS